MYNIDYILEGGDLKGYIIRRAKDFDHFFYDNSECEIIPDKVETTSTTNFYLKEIDKYTNRITCLKDLTPDAAELLAKKDYEEHVAKAETVVAEARKNKQILESMLIQVEAWKPPTEDHEGMKENMVDDLKREINKLERNYNPDDWIFQSVYLVKRQTGKEWHAEKLEKAKKCLKYCIKELAKETTRIESRNKWVKELKDNLEGV
jgi:hypothetical protein